MKNKNVLLISIIAVVVLLAAGAAVYFFRQSAQSPISGNSNYDYKKVAYNFRGKIMGKDAGGLLAEGAVLLLSNNKPQWMEQVIKFKISPDAKIFKMEGSGATVTVTASDFATIKIGDLVKIKADGLSVSGPEATAVDILIFDNQQ